MTSTWTVNAVSKNNWEYVKVASHDSNSRNVDSVNNHFTIKIRLKTIKERIKIAIT